MFLETLGYGPLETQINSAHKYVKPVHQVFLHLLPVFGARVPTGAKTTQKGGTSMMGWTLYYG